VTKPFVDSDFVVTRFCKTAGRIEKTKQATGADKLGSGQEKQPHDTFYTDKFFGAGSIFQLYTTSIFLYTVYTRFFFGSTLFFSPQIQPKHFSARLKSLLNPSSKRFVVFDRFEPLHSRSITVDAKDKDKFSISFQGLYLHVLKTSLFFSFKAFVFVVVVLFGREERQVNQIGYRAPVSLFQRTSFQYVHVSKGPRPFLVIGSHMATFFFSGCRFTCIEPIRLRNQHV
jgi:hypothetical protein